MQIALIGYGRMGKAVEKAALARGHHIFGRFSASPVSEHLSGADIAIEFSLPESAPGNLLTCFEAGVPVVSGTTGWLNRWAEVLGEMKNKNASLFYASNFSIGVHHFMNFARQQAAILSKEGDYDVHIEEVHHVHKVDSPSGTAIALAETILDEWPDKQDWILGDASDNSHLSVQSERLGEVPGTHRAIFTSEQDSIVIEHRAHGREGFALGAVKAAEFLKGKQGFYTMKDYLNR